MSRIFVYSDNLSARAEIGQDPDAGEQVYTARCVGCGPTAADLVEDTHERFSLEDAAEAAGLHVDSCTKCADDARLTTRPHDAGHRCRT
jgi:hypothetical protein